jgi:hypothetical protein
VHVRVVRFTGVDPERVKQLATRLDEAEAPPPGVVATGIQMLLDESQGTAVVLQFFENAEDMAAAEKAFSSMDASETPGTRASVDRTELKAERQM